MPLAKIDARPERRRGHLVPEVAIILPAYNEAAKLRDAVRDINVEIKGIPGTYEILLAVNGATDGTDAIAAKLEAEYGFVKHLSLKGRAGRGGALSYAFSLTGAEVVVYCDVDLATDTKHMRQLIDAVRGGYDIATGSRHLKGSEVRRSLCRALISRGYNTWVRLVLGSRVRDHQCGFKAFNRQAVLPLLAEVQDTRWFWDTELLVRAQRKGLRVFEFPVCWRHGGATKVVMTRDILYMASRVFRLRFELGRHRKRAFSRPLPDASVGPVC